MRSETKSMQAWWTACSRPLRSWSTYSIAFLGLWLPWLWRNWVSTPKKLYDVWSWYLNIIQIDLSFFQGNKELFEGPARVDESVVLAIRLARIILGRARSSSDPMIAWADFTVAVGSPLICFSLRESLNCWGRHRARFGCHWRIPIG
jgi:hypothetical protein